MTSKTIEFMDMTEIYLKNLTADGKSANTAANYATTLASFISYIAENNRNPDVTGVMEWKAYLSESGNSTTTIRQRMRELNACFSWAVGSGLWDENPITKAIVPKSKKAQPYENLLTEEEFMLLLSEKRPRYFRKNHAARDRSIVILFITTALRNSELRLLCPADMDADAGTIKVKNGKGIVLTCNAQIDRQTIDRTDTCTGGSIMPYYLVLREAAKIAGVKTVVEKGDCPWVGFTEHPAADGSVIVMAINFEPRAMECPVKINGKLGRVWRGDVKGDKITLAPNEVALFEVK